MTRAQYDRARDILAAEVRLYGSLRLESHQLLEAALNALDLAGAIKP